MNSLQGHLLIASPKLMDPNFVHTVVLMIRHDDDEVLGLVLNRPIEMTVEDALSQSGEEGHGNQDPLYQGGPCGGPLMVLHTDALQSETEVIDGVYFSTEREHVSAVLQEGEGQARYFIGYAGWSKGQLEGELLAGGWAVLPALPKHVFGDPTNLWQAVQAQTVLGHSVNPRIIPDDPSVN